MSLRSPFVLGLAVVIGSCHGGNSAGSPTLTVQSQLPAPGSTVDVDADVAVVFAAEPDAATLAADALQVRDGSGPLPGSLSYDAPSRTLRWTAIDELPRGATLSAQLADTVRAATGTALSTTYTWSFRVRGGVPAAPVTIASGVLTNTLPGSDSVFVRMYPDGGAQIALDSSSWTFGAGTVGPPEALPGGRVRGLHIDAAGQAVALTVPGTGVGLPVHVTRRDVAGTWQPPQMVLDTGPAALLGMRLAGNERGDLLASVDLGFTSPTYEQAANYWSAAATPATWQSLPLPLGLTRSAMRTSLDGAGRVATLRRFSGPTTGIAVDRHDPNTGAMTSYTIPDSTWFGIEGVGAARDGSVRALWHEPGNITRQSFAAPGADFTPATMLPIFVPGPTQLDATTWMTAPTGAMVGYNRNIVFRSEAGSSEWARATLNVDVLAGAISPRGEAVLLYFRLPDELRLVRWRAGEAIESPILLARVASPFVALRDGALAVDAAGRVVVAFVTDAPGDLIGIRVE